MKGSAWVLALLVGSAVGCAKTSDPASNKNTNWLRECTSDRTCGADLACLCGICTTPCGTADDCAVEGEGATCGSVLDERVSASCTAGETRDAVAICFAACEGDACDEAPPVGLDGGGVRTLSPGRAPAAAVDAGESLGGAGMGTLAGDGGPLDAGPGPTAPDANVDPLGVPCSERPGAWLRRADMPGASRGQAAAVHEGLIYSFGGDPTNYAVRAYDPDADSWTRKTDMPIGLYVLSAHAALERIYVIGGYGPQRGFTPAVQAYDPATDTWQQKTPRPTHRYMFASEVVGEKIYVIGGTGTLDDGPEPEEGSIEWENKDLVEIYDPVSDTWSSGTPAPQPFTGGASCEWEGKIYLFGGAGDNLTQIYDTASDSWSSGTPPPVVRSDHTCARRGDRLWLLGGRATGGAPLDLVEIYDPRDSSWSRATAMPDARYWFPAVTLNDEIYALGGEFQDFSSPTFAISKLDDVRVLCPIVASGP